MPDVLEDLLTRKGPVTRTSWDAETRTIKVKASGFADVRRFGFVERLSSDPAAWDLSRVGSNAGIPFLAAHNSFDLDAKLGRVLSVEVKRDGLYAVVKLSDNDPANALVRDLEAGIGCATSIGYAVDAWAVDTSGDLPVRTATRIRLLEISAVSVAADPNAAVRSIPSLPDEEAQMSTAPAPREFGPAERAALVEKAGLNGTFLRRHANVPEVEFHAALMDEMARRSERSAIQTAFDPNHYGDEDHEAPLARALGEALFARVTPGHILSPAAKRYANMPLAEMARLCLDRAGRDTRGSTGQLIERALHSTSDFSALLGDATGRTLRAAYDAAPVAIKAICRQATAPNFKARHALQFGSAPDLLKVNESGEFKRGTIEESKASYALATFGRIFAASRQALINDNLDAFSSVPRRLAQAAAAFEANFIADLVEGNPTMGDGVELFHATHKNLGAAGAINETTLSAARVAMSRQTGLGGELIAVRPKYLVVPPELETAGEKVLASIAATKTADANPFAGQLTLLVEPRLRSATAWYLAASPDAIDTIEYAYLEGVEGPELLTREGFDVDGTEFKVRLDFGAGAIDWRGIYKNPGT